MDRGVSPPRTPRFGALLELGRGERYPVAGRHAAERHVVEGKRVGFAERMKNDVLRNVRSDPG
jgi:hypothetical protein